ncbi:MAG TPA: NAD-dependent epimerase/dehydratase family protein, partial [Thermoanaerobaculia bacterium]|nr:NAD-dependent epimerase/dehydratase family protein [Thermoanaerobaculia bacterium]
PPPPPPPSTDGTARALLHGMKILVTGGTGVIGEGLMPELVNRGHSVRLLSRHADDDAKQWEGVEPFAGNVADAPSLDGAATGCDAVLHIAGIVTESPPELTFDAVNVGGTRNMLAEARRAGAKRFVYVSSLGADSGSSDYHKSKLAAEQLVQRAGLQWTIVRPGGVYGPGDEVISTILKMVRALPAVPVIDHGDQEFQPIWYEDLAKVLAAVVERNDLAGQTLEAAGPEITTMNDLLRRFGEITGRKPMRVPVPMALAQLTTKLASIAADLPIDESKLAMLRDKNVLRGRNAVEVLGLQSTPLERGLRELADALPETLPEEGVGSLEHKRFFAEIRGSRYSAAALMTQFRERVNDFMPVEFAAEPGAPEKIEQGITLTGSLPLRGHFQVRVEVAEPTQVVFATLEGHPLAGIVEFTTADVGGAVRFSIDVYTRASNFLDLVAVRTIGGPAQAANWRAVVQRVIDASGGTSDGVHEEKETLDEEEAARVEERVKRIVQERKREETHPSESAP